MPRMACRAAKLLHKQENGIVIAIQANGANQLLIARLFALAPDFLAAAAEIMGNARGETKVKGLFVHPGQHQHFQALGILGDSGQEAARKIRFQFHYTPLNVLHWATSPVS